jgi:hypothetical protein
MILTAEKLFLASTMIGSSDEEILIQGLKKHVHFSVTSGCVQKDPEHHEFEVHELQERYVKDLQTVVLHLT